MDATGAKASRGIVEWVDDVAAAAACAIGSRPRAALFVFAGLAILLASSNEATSATTLVAVSAICGALVARTPGRAPRIPVWVLPGAALALFLIHETTAATELDRTGLTLAPVAGALLAAAGCARREALPKLALLLLLAVGVAATVDTYTGTGLSVLESDVELAPALWSLAVAALLLLAAHHAWLVALLATGVVVALAPLLDVDPAVDTWTPLALLAAITAGRVARHLAEDADGSVASAAAERLSVDVHARPFASTVGLIAAAMAISGATAALVNAPGVWQGIIESAFAARADGFWYEDYWIAQNHIWGLMLASRPLTHLVALAVIAHGPLRAANATRRIQILLVVISVTLAAGVLTSLPWLLSYELPRGWDYVEALAGGGMLIAVAAPASGLLRQRRRAALEPLDLLFLGLAVAASPAGLLARNVEHGAYDWVEPWSAAPWMTAFVVPLVYLLLFHRVVRSAFRIRTIVIGALCGGLVAAASTLVVGVIQSDRTVQLGLFDVVHVWEIVARWLAAAALVALARLLSGPRTAPRSG